MAQRLKKQPWGAADFIVRGPDGNLVHFAQTIELRDVGGGGPGDGLSSRIGAPATGVLAAGRKLRCKLRREGLGGCANQAA